MDNLESELFGNDLFGESPKPSDDGKLRERFMIPPFTILNAREGWWQKRKRAWINLGIQSEIGRGASPGGAPRPAMDYSNNERGTGSGKPIKDQGLTWRISTGEYRNKNKDDLTFKNQNKLNEIMGNNGYESGTSIFDPVVCELAYRWFCPPEGQVVDPFSGGSVRGIVANKLQRKYLGVELRPEQIKANRDQVLELCRDNFPIYKEGDARDIKNICKEINDVDFIFSCPPYADLEVYSDDPRDLSTLGYDEFLKDYRQIIFDSVELLNENRFACFVVGDIRNKNGTYYGFPWHTIQAFEDAGANLYNEAVLVTAVGSLPIRVTNQFENSRKMGKTHQNVLVFVKGDPKKATRAISGQGEKVLKKEVSVKVSAKSLKLEFVPCSPSFIENVCHGKCCDAPSRPDGCMVTINPEEQHNIESLGGVVVNGLLKPRKDKKGGPFKVDGLCSLHGTKNKPFGCVASPFTLNSNNTLIVRNRYKMLPCYKASKGKIPAYKAHKASLELIFGEAEAGRISKHLDECDSDLNSTIRISTYSKLIENDEIKKNQI